MKRFEIEPHPTSKHWRNFVRRANKYPKRKKTCQPQARYRAYPPAHVVTRRAEHGMQGACRSDQPAPIHSATGLVSRRLASGAWSGEQQGGSKSL
jgi:hypothetical protein